MKKKHVQIILTLLFAFVISSSIAQQSSILERLKTMPEIKSITTLTTDTLFEAKYMLMVEQPLDHENPNSRSFTQRVFLSHLGLERPVVFVTEGYSAYYAISSKYVNELSWMLNANQVTVEHRYFGKSKPENAPWKFLTTAQAAADHHKIVELLKRVYDKSKWINTGISKGGQTTIYHRYYYPEDVDVSVGYVCPLNFSFEDKRVYSFLENVGSDSCRNALLRFQKNMLENKEVFLPKFTNKANAYGYTFPFDTETAYEMVILEYPFAFWQWGQIGCEDIPAKSAGDSAKFAHLLNVSPLDYFADQGLSRMRPFFYQAMTEIGYYGYDLEPYGDLISATEDNTFMFTMPDSVKVGYNYGKMKQVNNWLQSEAEKMLFIYGEYDPWSATAVEVSSNPSVQKIVKPRGSHRTRIKNLPEKQKDKVYRLLEKWLDRPVNHLK